MAFPTNTATSDCQKERLNTVRFGAGIPAVSGYNGLGKTNLSNR
jgi:AAA15 family ATPase/GTPase